MEKDNKNKETLQEAIARVKDEFFTKAMPNWFYLGKGKQEAWNDIVEHVRGDIGHFLSTGVNEFVLYDGNLNAIIRAKGKKKKEKKDRGENKDGATD